MKYIAEEIKKENNEVRFQIVDENGKIVDDYCGIGLPKRLVSKRLYCLSNIEGYSPYSYMKELTENLRNYELEWMEKESFSLYYSVHYSYENEFDLEPEERRNKFVERQMRRKNFSEQDTEKLCDFFDGVMNIFTKENTTRNLDQENAINTVDGPILIVAGPGTGKTYTLVERIVYLICSKEVEPKEILVSTFTEKGAKELLTRVTNKLDDLGVHINLNDMYIGTIHSICKKIVDKYIDYTNLGRHCTVVSQNNLAYILVKKGQIEALKKLPGYKQNFTTNPWGYPLDDFGQALEVLKAYENFEESLVNVDAMCKSNDEKTLCVGEIIRRVRKVLQENNWMTYTTMQTEVYHLLVEHPEIKKEITSGIKYLMIDEYQDTNIIQHQILLLLSDNEEKNHNICVVGDDDQSLYAFRGTSVSGFLKFYDNEYFDESERKDIITLKTNYRSNPDIIKFYNKWMEEPSTFKWGGNRSNKTIIPSYINKSKMEKATPAVFSAIAEEETRCEKIFRLINNLKDTGKIDDYNQIAFLCNSVANAQVVNVINYLQDRGIGVYSPRGKQLFKREEVRLVLGCLIACFPEYCDKLYERGRVSDKIRNARNYYINECLSFARAKMKTNSGLKAQIGYLINNRNKFYGRDITVIVYQFLGHEPFIGYLDEGDSEENGVIAERKKRNIKKILSILAEYKEVTNECLPKHETTAYITEFFEDYLSQIIKMGESEYEDDREYAPSGCVSFMTIHQSKGMEFPIVITELKNIIKDPFLKKFQPQLQEYTENKTDNSVELSDMHNLWRQYYVAFSRAQNLLVITASTTATTKDGRVVPSKYDEGFDYIVNGLPDVSEADFSNFEFEKVKEVSQNELKEQYAFTSAISVYQNCPRSYKFFSYYGFPKELAKGAMKGTVVHEGIERIHQNMIELKEKLDVEELKEWVKDNYERLAKENHFTASETDIIQAQTEVERYFLYRKKNQVDILKAEASISDNKENYILNGQVDLIVKNKDNTVSIIDFKSEEKPTEGNDEQVNTYKKQLDVYSYLVETILEETVKDVSLYYTKDQSDNPMLTFQKDSEEIKETIEEFDQIANSIARKDFEGKTEDSKYCNRCLMKNYCKTLDARK